MGRNKTSTIIDGSRRLSYGASHLGRRRCTPLTNKHLQNDQQEHPGHSTGQPANVDHARHHQVTMTAATT